MVQEWKQIKELNYEASINGEIRNKKTGRIIKQRICTDGYLIVDIQINKKNKTFKTHRLIAETFLERDSERNEVDHINRVKTDNTVENLRWVTRVENMNNVDWSSAIRNKISKEKITEIAELLKKGKCIDEIYTLINQSGFFILKTMDERLRTLGREKQKKFDENLDLMLDKYKKKATDMGYNGDLRFKKERGNIVILVVI